MVEKGWILEVCVDYRKLNLVIHRDAYPIPRIDSTLDFLADFEAVYNT